MLNERLGMTDLTSDSEMSSDRRNDQRSLLRIPPRSLIAPQMGWTRALPHISFATDNFS